MDAKERFGMTEQFHRSMSLAWEVASAVFIIAALFTATWTEPEDAVFLGGLAITAGTLALVNEHRANRGHVLPTGELTSGDLEDDFR
jgi:hypothetical protein